MSALGDYSARASFTAAAGRRADELVAAIDPPLMPSTDAEWVTRLAASLGCIACTAPGDDLEACLVEHAADLLLWAETLERERRVA